MVILVHSARDVDPALVQCTDCHSKKLKLIEFSHESSDKINALIDQIKDLKKRIAEMEGEPPEVEPAIVLLN